MHHYNKRIIDKLTSLSSVKLYKLEDISNEWFYTGECIDNGGGAETEDNYLEYICELCEHKNIRFHFIIRNDINDNELKVGSTCITKFSIKGHDLSGNLIEGKILQKKMQRDVASVKAKQKIIQKENSISALRILYKNAIMLIRKKSHQLPINI